MSHTDPLTREKRARTAIVRADLSRPLKCAIADGLVSTKTHVFDYGCGRGGDLRCLAAMGYAASGWDPIHRPDSELRRSPIVNLGYVVNVIEDIDERGRTLRNAWDLAEDVLVVSARMRVDGHTLREVQEFADGCLTCHGTFQKFFTQQELRDWIERTIQVKAVPAAPGVFYAFRDDLARTDFIASRFRRRSVAPRLTKSEELFTTHQALLEPLIQFVSKRGRLAYADELAESSEIVAVFGSLRRAFRVVLSATEAERWNQISQERQQDLLVYLALSQFDGRPSFGHLALALQRDVRSLFGTYKKACAQADDLLFSLGKPTVLRSACSESPIGKLTPTALYIHESALREVSPVLRLYEGCARGYLGRVEGANIIKLHLDDPMVSYLRYPEFDVDPHPPLASALTVHLQTFRIRARDYTSSLNRPILHRKELFVSPHYPSHRKFARLTRIEESKGLYQDVSHIGFQDGWNDALARSGLCFRGHRLLSCGRLKSNC